MYQRLPVMTNYTLKRLCPNCRFNESIIGIDGTETCKACGHFWLSQTVDIDVPVIPLKKKNVLIIRRIHTDMYDNQYFTEERISTLWLFIFLIIWVTVFIYITLHS